MNPPSRFEPFSPFPVFVGSIDKIARMDRESGMRSFFVGRPDNARPEGQNGILGVSKVEEGERGGFCLGGAKLNPFTPAIPAANSVSVEGIWLQLREFNRVVVNDHLGGIDKFELLCSGLVAFCAFIERAFGRASAISAEASLTEVSVRQVTDWLVAVLPVHVRMIRSGSGLACSQWRNL